MRIIGVFIITSKRTVSVLGPFCLLLLILLIGVDVDPHGVVRVCRVAIPALALIAAAAIFIANRGASLFAKLVFILLLPLVLYNAYRCCQFDIHYINHPFFIQLFENKPWTLFLISYIPMIPYSLLMGIVACVSGEETDRELFTHSSCLYSLSFLLAMACNVFAYEATLDGTLFMSILMALMWTFLGGVALSAVLAVASLPYYAITGIADRIG